MNVCKFINNFGTVYDFVCFSKIQFGIKAEFKVSQHRVTKSPKKKSPKMGFFLGLFATRLNVIGCPSVLRCRVVSVRYKNFPYVQKEIKVIPNFICLDDYNFENWKRQKKMYAPNGERLLIHVSNFRKVKRVEDVLRVFDKVRKVIPSKLILIGDGPERGNIEKLCRELDICNDVRSLGKIVNPEQILSIADLFLLPSETESFGLAALEAMASKVPVISTNSGGLPEVNVNGFSGYMSNVGDVDDMANNAISILKDDTELNKFKANAYQQAKKFDITKILPMYEELYMEVATSNLSS